MNVIAINGSPKKDGNTYTILNEMKQELEKQDINVEIVHMGNKIIRGCTACGYCNRSEDKKCVFNDDLVNDTAEKMSLADGIILGSPVYYAGVAGTMKCFLDRVFYSGSSKFTHKVGVGVVAVRRSGGVTTFNQLNNYFNLAEMIIPPSQYWGVIHGGAKGEVLQDPEGIQTARKSAKSMAWILKTLQNSKNIVELPEQEKRIFTNFVR